MNPSIDSPQGAPIQILRDLQLRAEAAIEPDPVATGEVTQLTGDDAAYSDLCVSPDGEQVYALRSTVAAPSGP